MDQLRQSPKVMPKDIVRVVSLDRPKIYNRIGVVKGWDFAVGYQSGDKRPTSLVLGVLVMLDDYGLTLLLEDELEPIPPF